MLKSAAVVVTTYNHARFLREALESVVTQTIRPAEIIVVDDGSTDHPELVVSDFAAVHLVRQPNKGLAAARNAGWLASGCDFVVFLDADDRLCPDALAINLASILARPDCGFVYGAYRKIDEAGRPVSAKHFRAAGEDAYASLLRENCVAMHGTVMYRRQCLTAVGGFNAALQACEDYDLYLRLARLFPVRCSDELVAEYRIHSTNMSHNASTMLAAALEVLNAQRREVSARDAWSAAYSEGMANWVRFFAPECSLNRHGQPEAHEAMGVQLARAIIDWRRDRYQDVGFPLVMHLADEGPALLVHPLPDLATTARIIDAVPEGHWRVRAEGALLDSRAPPVSFRVGVESPTGEPAYSAWVDVNSAAETCEIEFVPRLTSTRRCDLLLQTKLTNTEHGAYAHAAFRNVCLLPVGRIGRETESASVGEQ